MKIMKILTVAIAGVILLGCVGGTSHKNATRNVQNNKEEMRSFTVSENEPAAIFIDTPRNELVTYERVVVPDWYTEDHEILSNGLPFYFIAEQIAKKHNLFVKYGPDVDQNIPIHLMYEEGTAHGALEALASSTGLNYEVKNGYITWTLFQVETFDLRYVGGEFNYLVGSKGGKEDDKGAGSSTDITVGSNKDQYQNVEAKNVNLYKEIRNALNLIVDKAGEVIISEASTSVVVRTTSARMSRVKSYMASINKQLSKMVRLDVKVLKVRTSQTGASGIDWNAVRTKSNGVLGFNSNIVTSAASSLFGGAPSTVSMLKTGGSYDASSFLITALEEQGSVSVVTETRVTTQINRVAEVEISELQGYIARTEVTPNKDAEPSVAITPGTVREGYSLFLLANTDEQNRVYIHISSLLSDLISIDRKEVGASAIETPNFVENKFSQTVIVKEGETSITNGIKQAVSRSNAMSPIGNRIASNFKSGEQYYDETIVLITPTVMDMSN